MAITKKPLTKQARIDELEANESDLLMLLALEQAECRDLKERIADLEARLTAQAQEDARDAGRWRAVASSNGLTYFAVIRLDEFGDEDRILVNAEAEDEVDAAIAAQQAA